MTCQEAFKNQYFDLVLKKSLSVHSNSMNYYLDLVDEGKTLCIVSLLHENTKGFSQEFVQEIEELEAKGLVVDRTRGQIFIARKHDFSTMSPHNFSIRMIQFLSEIQSYRKDIDEFRSGEYAFIKRQ